MPEMKSLTEMNKNPDYSEAGIDMLDCLSVVKVIIEIVFLYVVLLES